MKWPLFTTDIHLFLELARPNVALIGKPHLIGQLPQSSRHDTLMPQDIGPVGEAQSHTNATLDTLLHCLQ